MQLDKRIKLYLIVLLGFLASGVSMSLITAYGNVTDNLLSLPLIGTVPVLGAGIFTVYWWFWGRKQAD